MKKLMKYEWKKSLFSKYVILVFTALAEILFLVGLFIDQKNKLTLTLGISGLFLCAAVGIVFIGIESLLTFSKDLSTKQSYMLFLTPRSSYQILGSKVMMNALTLLLAGVFFTLLAAFDVSVMVAKFGGLKEMFRLLETFANIQIDWNQLGPTGILVFADVLVSWLMTIVIGDLAIVLSATLFNGKKFSRLISFVLFIILSILCSRILTLIPGSDSQTMKYILVMAGGLVLTTVMYAITGWIMEKKLSV
ncbi:MAG: hypothetical protein HUJ72_12510 [Blautia sp.]|nr:hypothetical protein [Blautia sp.]